MKTIIFTFAIIIAAVATADSQDKYFTRTGHIKFFSKAPLENIEAHNYQATGIMDVRTGEVAFSILMKGFQFEKALMQEHFNENFVESDKYPKSSFSGTIVNFDELDLTKNSKNEVEVEGDLTIHGVTKSVVVEGELEKKGDRILIRSVFPVTVADYDIKIPTAVINNIAEVVEVTVEADLEPYQN